MMSWKTSKAKFMVAVVLLMFMLSVGVNSSDDVQNEDTDSVEEIPVHDDFSKILDNIEEKPLDVPQTFYSFIAIDITGKVIKLEKFKGMVSLVVNVASECGFTDGHYKALVSMQKSLGKNGKFTVLAFPCNQFGAQEPKSNAEIAQFVKEKYSVNFPMFAKINVLDEQVPFSWLYLISDSHVPPSWNFFKYLIDTDGKVIKAWGPWNSVEDIYMEVKKAVDAAEAQDNKDEL